MVRKVVHGTWYGLALLSITILLAGIPVVLHGEPIGVSQEHLSFSQDSLYNSLRLVAMTSVLISGALSVGMAALLFRRRREERMGLFLSFYLLGYGILLAGPIELLQPIWPAIPWVNSFVLLPIFIGPVTMYLIATFPDGRFVPRWSRWLLFLSALPIPAVLLSAQDGSLRTLTRAPPLAIGVLAVLYIALFVSAVYAQIFRYRRVSSAIEQRQTRWVMYALSLWLIVVAVSSMGWLNALTLPKGSPAPWWLAFAELAWVVSTLFFPVSLTVAILRHGLFDIDGIINRSLVYGGLTVGIIALYAFIVGISGLLMQTNANLAGFLLSTGIVVVLFNPLYQRLQQLADRAVPQPKKSERNSDTEQGPLRTARGTPLQSDSPSTSSGVTRIAGWLWYPVAALALTVYLVSLPGYAAALTVAPHSGGVTVAPGSAAYGLNVLSAVLSIGAAGLSLGLAVLVFRRRPHDRMATFLSIYMLGHGTIVAGPVEFLDYLVPGIAEASVTYLSPAVMGPATIALLAIFPDGRFVPRWTKGLTYGSLLFVPLSVVFAKPDLTELVDQIAAAILYLVFFSTGAAMIYAQIYRHRNVSTPVQRQQTKWFVFGFAAWLGMAAFSSIPYLWLDSLPAGAPYPPWAPAMSGFWWLATAALPISLTMAITRSGLYEIDVIINRTLVYGALTACVIAVYALVVGGLAVLFQSSGNLLVSLLATGLVAVLFQPLRQRLQSSVNRMMFGERENPVTVLSKLGEKLESTISPDEALESIVETVALSLKLPYAAIQFEKDYGRRLGVFFGRPTQTTVDFRITFHSDEIGHLVVSPRHGEEKLGESDRVLLENIARQAGAAARAAKLASDLQQSRMDLVAAREEERRRLRRDLHDGLGPQLASQSLTLDAIERRLETDPEAIPFLIANLKDQSRSAIRDIRRLVYELRPPALDELGLIGAISELVPEGQAPGLSLSVGTQGDLPALPAAVEVAAYRIAQEAVTNVIRHSGAKACHVDLVHIKRGETEYLRVSVRDDGRGIPEGREPGVGLHSMRERAEELGGSLEIPRADPSGTTVTAWLPFPVRAE